MTTSGRSSGTGVFSSGCGGMVDAGKSGGVYIAYPRYISGPGAGSDVVGSLPGSSPGIRILFELTGAKSQRGG